jgi:hypothetical protein
MPFTAQNISRMTAQLKQAAGALLQPQDVDLYGAGTVQVPLHVSTRRASESDLTAGAQANTSLVATIDAATWDAMAGRPPQKGDTIWWVGQRHAVVESHVSAPGGQAAFYKATLQG